MFVERIANQIDRMLTNDGPLVAMDWMGILFVVATISNKTNTEETRVFPPVQDTEKFAGNEFPVLGNPALVDAALKGSHELISILFDHESHELLSKCQSVTMSQRDGSGRSARNVNAPE